MTSKLNYYLFLINSAVLNLQNHKKRILITGATGFIGRHFLKDVDLRDYAIRLITRSKTNLLTQQYPSFEVMEADLNELDQMLVAAAGVDIIINTAAEVRNAAFLEKTNIGGTQNLIKVIEKHQIKKLIHLSSVGVAGYQYSYNKLEVNEQSACNPKNEYERTKLASEQLLLEAQKKLPFDLDIIRPTNVFGEEHPFNALLGLINYTKSGKPFLYSKDAQVNYVYVKDISFLIEKLITMSEPKGILNVGKSMHLIEFYHLIKSVLDTKNKEIVIPDFMIKILHNFSINKMQSVSNQVIYCDHKLKEFFNYPFGELEGLKRTIAYYKQQNLLT